MDEDMALALSLQEQFEKECDSNEVQVFSKRDPEKPLSIVDSSWELIDPNPNIHELFIQFNASYFWGRLAGVEVRWSPRMTLCAGLCCYEGRGGLCSIRLSLPLLKLRPRHDLVQTLLHEMIHAYLFVTDNNKDHDGHGPEFHKHMYRINKETGSKITVYHTFHDEVNEYRQHWWKCNGPCQKRPPYYGVVRRAMNRAPSPRDPWWADHQRSCGGVYTKIKEPEGYGKKKGSAAGKGKEAQGKNNKSSSSRGADGAGNTKTGGKNIKDITNYFGKGGHTSRQSDKDSSAGSPKRRKLDDSTDDGDRDVATQKIVPFVGKGKVLGGVTQGTGSHKLVEERLPLMTETPVGTQSASSNHHTLDEVRRRWLKFDESQKVNTSKYGYGNSTRTDTRIGSYEDISKGKESTVHNGKSSGLSRSGASVKNKDSEVVKNASKQSSKNQEAIGKAASQKSPSVIDWFKKPVRTSSQDCSTKELSKAGRSTDSCRDTDWNKNSGRDDERNKINGRTNINSSGKSNSKKGEGARELNRKEGSSGSGGGHVSPGRGMNDSLLIEVESPSPPRIGQGQSQELPGCVPSPALGSLSRPIAILDSPSEQPPPTLHQARRELVTCPVCLEQVDSSTINAHLDRCIES